MRKLVLLALLVPSLAYGQAVKQNEAQSVIYPSALQSGPHSSVDQYGNQMCSLRAGTASATNPIVREDSAFPDLQALLAVGVKLQSALTVDAAADDAGSLKAGLDGRLITTLAPAGEFWDSTSAADITTATTGTLKGSVASNRIYVHSWGCFNTGGAATRVYLEDGSGTRYSHCNLAATTGECFKTLPTPIRLPSASALNVNVVTAGSATRCEAHGYISVN